MFEQDCKIIFKLSQHKYLFSHTFWHLDIESRMIKDVEQCASFFPYIFYSRLCCNKRNNCLIYNVTILKAK